MNRRVLSIAGGATIVLLLAWYVLLWSPKGAELDKAHTRKTEAESQVSELQARLVRLKDAQRRAPQLTADLERVQAAVPAKAELAQFILDADDAASAAGIDFLAVSPSTPSLSTSGTASEVKLALNVTGDYFRILDFLDRLQDMPRIVVLDTVDVGTDTGSEGLKVALSGRMFTTAPPAATPGQATTTTTTVAEGKK